MKKKKKKRINNYNTKKPLKWSEEKDEYQNDKRTQNE